MPTQPLTALVRRLRSALDADALANSPDADLLARFRTARDPAAFEALARRHGPRVLAACRRVLADPADIDDACQATFLVLMRNPRAVRDVRALGGWLAGVAHRVALKALARRRRREQIEARARPRSETCPDLSWKEACVILHEELDHLPDRYRLPLILCYLDGLARDEAAARLGRSVNSVKKALDLGRDRLRRRLVRRGVTLSAGLLAAAAGPVGGEPFTDLVTPAVGGTVRPAVAALARSLRGGSRARAVGVGLAATVLAMGLGLGFPGGPRPAPVAGKDAPPAKEAPKIERIVVSGKVVDPEGKPVAGATLSLAGWEAVPGKGAEPKTLGTTGADGRFDVAVAPDDLARFPQAQLVATAKKYGLALHPLTGEGAKDVTLTLAHDTEFLGSLIDRQKQPVVGARVRVVAVWQPDKDDPDAALRKLQKAGWGAATAAEPAEPLTRRVSAGAGTLPGVSTDVRTNAAGRFAINGLGHRQFAALVFDRPGMVTAEVIVLHQSGPSVLLPVAGGDPKGAVVTVHRHDMWHMAAASRGVHGRVTDRLTGQPLKDVVLRAAGGSGYVWAATDRDGWYHFDGLGRPPARLTAEPAADTPYFPLSQSVDDTPGREEPVRLNFRLTRGVWLSGRVVEARTRTGVPGARVVYEPDPDNKSPSAVLVAGEPGRPDEVVASVRGVATAGPDGRFRLPAAVGRGWLMVESPRGDRYFAADVRDLQGDVADRAPPRELAVGINGKVSPAAFAAIAAVNVDPDRDRDVTITLEPGVTPEIRFVDPDGKPLRGVVTDDRRLVPAGPAKALPESVRTTERLNPDRPIPLTVFHPETGLGVGYRPTADDPGPWTVTLRPTATVTARLLGRNGKPLADVPVYVHAADGRAPLSPKQMEFRTDKDGRVKVPGIVGGADYLLWCLELAEKPGDSRSRTFRAAPGEVKDLGDLRAGP